MTDHSLIGQTIRFPKSPVRISETLKSDSSKMLFLGKDPENRTLLIKYFTLPTQEEPFRRELNAYQQIGANPKIITHLDSLEEKNLWGAILLEYCNGGDLKEFMKEDEISEQQVMTILRDVVYALNHIHQKGIAHRKLRPESIYITTDFKFKLGDFSSAISEEEISKLYGADLSDDIEANTHPDYRAPEQLDLTPGYPLGVQVDMWGLGCLTYELLFHQSAFKIEQDQLRGKFKTPNRQISGWWRMLLSRLFEVNPRERANAQEIIQLIQENTVAKPMYSDGPETPNKIAATSFTNIFMKSSNSWVKAVTIDNDAPPEAQYLNKLIGKAWTKPFKITKFYKSLVQRPLEKTTVALKCLVVLHKYMFGGPKQVFTQDVGPNQFLDAVQHIWNSSSKTKKDKFATDYFRGLIGHYCNALKEKAKLHLETRTLGNWTENDTLDVNALEFLLNYWYKLIQLSNILFMGVDELLKLRAAIAALLLEEQERIDLLVLQGIRTFSINDHTAEITSKYYQYQQHTLSLITTFRQRHPQVALPQMSNIQNLSDSKDPSHVDINKQRRATQIEHPVFKDKKKHLTDISHTGDTKISYEHNLGTQESRSATLPPNDASPIQVERDSHSLINESPDSKNRIEDEIPPNKPSSNNSVEKPTDKNMWASLQDSPWIIKSDELTTQEEIGVGSSCTVYKGLYRHTPVAIKVMRKSNVSGAMENEFNRELTTLMRLRHPSLVLFMGACVDTQLCIVTEFCAGGSLFKLLYEDREVKLSWKQRIKIAKDVAQGMAFLHSSNPPIIYRDMKSLNLLLAEPVTGPNDYVQIKIADFGISKFVNDDLMTGQMGTCHWMAPEVLSSQPYTIAADVYSYGIVLWEILSRETPYRGINPVAIPYKVLQLGERPDMNKIPSNSPIELKELIEQCWSGIPEERPTFSSILQSLNNLAI